MNDLSPAEALERCPLLLAAAVVLPSALILAALVGFHCGSGLVRRRWRRCIAEVETAQRAHLARMDAVVRGEQPKE